MEGVFEDDERRLLDYFEATYVGRRVPGGRRRPLFDTALRNVESGIPPGPSRTKNAFGAPPNACASSVTQAGRAPVRKVRRVSPPPTEYELRGIIGCRAEPITDREISELQTGQAKEPNPRQQERSARLATLSVRSAGEEDIERLHRGAARNYMARLRVE